MQKKLEPLFVLSLRTIVPSVKIIYFLLVLLGVEWGEAHEENKERRYGNSK